MTFDLSQHPYFEAWTDPDSGMTSYILTERVAPLQQSFYFTNASVSADEQWLWFYTAFPPSPHKFLGAVSLDPAYPVKFHFPQAGFTSASPLVAPSGDAVYFCMGPSVWRLDVRGQLDKICTLDADYIRQRRLYRLATHLTLSADGRYFLLDGEVGNHWFVGAGDVQTGRVRIIKEFIHHFNHAQFSPVDPQVFILAQDWFHDKITGQRYHYDLRTWLMCRSRFATLIAIRRAATGAPISRLISGRPRAARCAAWIARRGGRSISFRASRSRSGGAATITLTRIRSFRRAIRGWFTRRPCAARWMWRSRRWRRFAPGWARLVNQEAGMDALEAIRKRRSVRAYTGDPIPRQDLETIVDAGRWAASGYNAQPWNFIVVTDRAMIEKLKVAAAWMDKAGAIIAVVLDPSTKYWLEDGSAAVENMLIAAAALGYGSCWLEGYTLPHEQEFKALLGVPDEKRLLTLVPIGVPVTWPTKDKKPLAQVLHWEKF